MYLLSAALNLENSIYILYLVQVSYSMNCLHVYKEQMYLDHQRWSNKKEKLSRESKLPKEELTIVFNNTQLKNVNSKKRLGLKIDKPLTWKDYVNNTGKTISRNLELLRRIKIYLPHQTRITFTKPISNPISILTIVIQYGDNWPHSQNSYSPKDNT